MAFTTCAGRAPNATRTPISRVRRATAYAVMLKMPTSVSSSPKTPSIVSSSIRCRGSPDLLAHHVGRRSDASDEHAGPSDSAVCFSRSSDSAAPVSQPHDHGQRHVRRLGSLRIRQHVHLRLDAAPADRCAGCRARPRRCAGARGSSSRSAACGRPRSRRSTAAMRTALTRTASPVARSASSKSRPASGRTPIASRYPGSTVRCGPAMPAPVSALVKLYMPPPVKAMLIDRAGRSDLRQPAQRLRQRGVVVAPDGRDSARAARLRA